MRLHARTEDTDSRMRKWKINNPDMQCLFWGADCNQIVRHGCCNRLFLPFLPVNLKTVVKSSVWRCSVWKCLAVYGHLLPSIQNFPSKANALQLRLWIQRMPIKLIRGNFFPDVVCVFVQLIYLAAVATLCHFWLRSHERHDIDSLRANPMWKC